MRMPAAGLIPAGETASGQPPAPAADIRAMSEPLKMRNKVAKIETPGGGSPDLVP